MSTKSKKFRHPAGVALRQGLDARRYRKTDEGKAEKQTRKAHNERFSPNVDKKTKRALKKSAKKSDAAKGATMRRNDVDHILDEAYPLYRNRLGNNLPRGAVMRARGGTFKGVF